MSGVQGVGGSNQPREIGTGRREAFRESALTVDHIYEDIAAIIKDPLFFKYENFLNDENGNPIAELNDVGDMYITFDGKKLNSFLGGVIRNINAIRAIYLLTDAMNQLVADTNSIIYEKEVSAFKGAEDVGKRLNAVEQGVTRFAMKIIELVNEKNLAVYKDRMAEIEAERTGKSFKEGIWKKLKSKETWSSHIKGEGPSKNTSLGSALWPEVKKSRTGIWFHNTFSGGGYDIKTEGLKKDAAGGFLGVITECLRQLTFLSSLFDADQYGGLDVTRQMNAIKEAIKELSKEAPKNPKEDMNVRQRRRATRKERRKGRRSRRKARRQYRRAKGGAAARQKRRKDREARRDLRISHRQDRRTLRQKHRDELKGLSGKEKRERRRELRDERKTQRHDLRNERKDNRIELREQRWGQDEPAPMFEEDDFFSYTAEGFMDIKIEAFVELKKGLMDAQNLQRVYVAVQGALMQLPTTVRQVMYDAPSESVANQNVLSASLETKLQAQSRIFDNVVQLAFEKKDVFNNKVQFFINQDKLERGRWMKITGLVLTIVGAALVPVTMGGSLIIMGIGGGMIGAAELIPEYTVDQEYDVGTLFDSGDLDAFLLAVTLSAQRRTEQIEDMKYEAIDSMQQRIYEEMKALDKALVDTGNQFKDIDAALIAKIREKITMLQNTMRLIHSLAKTMMEATLSVMSQMYEMGAPFDVNSLDAVLEAQLQFSNFVFQMLEKEAHEVINRHNALMGVRKRRTEGWIKLITSTVMGFLGPGFSALRGPISSLAINTKWNPYSDRLATYDSAEDDYWKADTTIPPNETPEARLERLQKEKLKEAYRNGTIDTGDKYLGVDSDKMGSIALEINRLQNMQYVLAQLRKAKQDTVRMVTGFMTGSRFSDQSSDTALSILSHRNTMITTNLHNIVTYNSLKSKYNNSRREADKAFKQAWVTLVVGGPLAIAFPFAPFVGIGTSFTGWMFQRYYSRTGVGDYKSPDTSSDFSKQLDQYSPQEAEIFSQIDDGMIDQQYHGFWTLDHSKSFELKLRINRLFNARETLAKLIQSMNEVRMLVMGRMGYGTTAVFDSVTTIDMRRDAVNTALDQKFEHLQNLVERNNRKHEHRRQSIMQQMTFYLAVGAPIVDVVSAIPGAQALKAVSVLARTLSTITQAVARVAAAAAKFAIVAKVAAVVAKSSRPIVRVAKAANPFVDSGLFTKIMTRALVGGVVNASRSMVGFARSVNMFTAQNLLTRVMIRWPIRIIAGTLKHTVFDLTVQKSFMDVYAKSLADEYKMWVDSKEEANKGFGLNKEAGRSRWGSSGIDSAIAFDQLELLVLTFQSRQAKADIESDRQRRVRDFFDTIWSSMQEAAQAKAPAAAQAGKGKLKGATGRGSHGNLTNAKNFVQQAARAKDSQAATVKGAANVVGGIHALTTPGNLVGRVVGRFNQAIGGRSGYDLKIAIKKQMEKMGVEHKNLKDHIAEISESVESGEIKKQKDINNQKLAQLEGQIQACDQWLNTLNELDQSADHIESLMSQIKNEKNPEKQTQLVQDLQSETVKAVELMSQELQCASQHYEAVVKPKYHQGITENRSSRITGFVNTLKNRLRDPRGEMAAMEQNQVIGVRAQAIQYYVRGLKITDQKPGAQKKVAANLMMKLLRSDKQSFNQQFGRLLTGGDPSIRGKVAKQLSMSDSKWDLKTRAEIVKEMIDTPDAKGTLDESVRSTNITKIAELLASQETSTRTLGQTMQISFWASGETARLVHSLAAQDPSSSDALMLAEQTRLQRTHTDTKNGKLSSKADNLVTDLLVFDEAKTNAMMNAAAVSTNPAARALLKSFQNTRLNIESHTKGKALKHADINLHSIWKRVIKQEASPFSLLTGSAQLAIHRNEKFSLIEDTLDKMRPTARFTPIASQVQRQNKNYLKSLSQDARGNIILDSAAADVATIFVSSSASTQDKAKWFLDSIKGRKLTMKETQQLDCVIAQIAQRDSVLAKAITNQPFEDSNFAAVFESAKKNIETHEQAKRDIGTQIRELPKTMTGNSAELVENALTDIIRPIAAESFPQDEPNRKRAEINGIHELMIRYEAQKVDILGELIHIDPDFAREVISDALINREPGAVVKMLSEVQGSFNQRTFGNFIAGMDSQTKSKLLEAVLQQGEHNIQLFQQLLLHQDLDSLTRMVDFDLMNKPENILNLIQHLDQTLLDLPTEVKKNAHVLLSYIMSQIEAEPALLTLDEFATINQSAQSLLERLYRQDPAAASRKAMLTVLHSDPPTDLNPVFQDVKSAAYMFLSHYLEPKKLAVISAAKKDPNEIIGLFKALNNTTNFKEIRQALFNILVCQELDRIRKDPSEIEISAEIKELLLSRPLSEARLAEMVTADELDERTLVEDNAQISRMNDLRDLLSEVIDVLTTDDAPLGTTVAQQLLDHVLTKYDSDQLKVLMGDMIDQLFYSGSVSGMTCVLEAVFTSRSMADLTPTIQSFLKSDLSKEDMLGKNFLLAVKNSLSTSAGEWFESLLETGDLQSDELIASRLITEIQHDLQVFLSNKDVRLDGNMYEKAKSELSVSLPLLENQIARLKMASIIQQYVKNPEELSSVSKALLQFLKEDKHAQDHLLDLESMMRSADPSVKESIKQVLHALEDLSSNGNENKPIRRALHAITNRIGYQADVSPEETSLRQLMLNGSLQIFMQEQIPQFDAPLGDDETDIDLELKLFSTAALKQNFSEMSKSMKELSGYSEENPLIAGFLKTFQPLGDETFFNEMILLDRLLSGDKKILDEDLDSKIAHFILQAGQCDFQHTIRDLIQSRIVVGKAEPEAAFKNIALDLAGELSDPENSLPYQLNVCLRIFTQMISAIATLDDKDRSSQILGILNEVGPPYDFENILPSLLKDPLIEPQFFHNLIKLIGEPELRTLVFHLSIDDAATLITTLSDPSVEEEVLGDKPVLTNKENIRIIIQELAVREADPEKYAKEREAELESDKDDKKDKGDAALSKIKAETERISHQEVLATILSKSPSVDQAYELISELLSCSEDNQLLISDKPLKSDHALETAIRSQSVPFTRQLVEKLMVSHEAKDQTIAKILVDALHNNDPNHFTQVVQGMAPQELVDFLGKLALQGDVTTVFGLLPLEKQDLMIRQLAVQRVTREDTGDDKLFELLTDSQSGVSQVVSQSPTLQKAMDVLRLITKEGDEPLKSLVKFHILGQTNNIRDLFRDDIDLDTSISTLLKPNSDYMKSVAQGLCSLEKKAGNRDERIDVLLRWAEKNHPPSVPAILEAIVDSDLSPEEKSALLPINTAIEGNPFLTGRVNGLLNREPAVDSQEMISGYFYEVAHSDADLGQVCSVLKKIDNAFFQDQIKHLQEGNPEFLQNLMAQSLQGDTALTAKILLSLQDPKAAGDFLEAYMSSDNPDPALVDTVLSQMAKSSIGFSKEVVSFLSNDNKIKLFSQIHKEYPSASADQVSRWQDLAIHLQKEIALGALSTEDAPRLQGMITRVLTWKPVSEFDRQVNLCAHRFSSGAKLSKEDLHGLRKGMHIALRGFEKTGFHLNKQYGSISKMITDIAHKRQVLELDISKSSKTPGIRDHLTPLYHQLLGLEYVDKMMTSELGPTEMDSIKRNPAIFSFLIRSSKGSALLDKIDTQEWDGIVSQDMKNADRSVIAVTMIAKNPEAALPLINVDKFDAADYPAIFEAVVKSGSTAGSKVVNALLSKMKNSQLSDAVRQLVAKNRFGEINYFIGEEDHPIQAHTIVQTLLEFEWEPDQLISVWGSIFQKLSSEQKVQFIKKYSEVPELKAFLEKRLSAIDIKYFNDVADHQPGLADLLSSLDPELFTQVHLLDQLMSEDGVAVFLDKLSDLNSALQKHVIQHHLLKGSQDNIRLLIENMPSLPAATATLLLDSLETLFKQKPESLNVVSSIICETQQLNASLEQIIGNFEASHLDIIFQDIDGEAGLRRFIDLQPFLSGQDAVVTDFCEKNTKNKGVQLYQAGQKLQVANTKGAQLAILAELFESVDSTKIRTFFQHRVDVETIELAEQCGKDMKASKGAGKSAIQDFLTNPELSFAYIKRQLHLTDAHQMNRYHRIQDIRGSAAFYKPIERNYAQANSQMVQMMMLRVIPNLSSLTPQNRLAVQSLIPKQIWSWLPQIDRLPDDAAKKESFQNVMRAFIDQFSSLSQDQKDAILASGDGGELIEQFNDMLGVLLENKADMSLGDQRQLISVHNYLKKSKKSAASFSEIQIPSDRVSADFFQEDSGAHLFIQNLSEGAGPALSLLDNHKNREQLRDYFLQMPLSEKVDLMKKLFSGIGTINLDSKKQKAEPAFFQMLKRSVPKDENDPKDKSDPYFLQLVTVFKHLLEEKCLSVSDVIAISRELMLPEAQNQKENGIQLQRGEGKQAKDVFRYNIGQFMLDLVQLDPRFKAYSPILRNFLPKSAHPSLSGEQVISLMDTYSNQKDQLVLNVIARELSVCYELGRFKIQKADAEVVVSNLDAVPADGFPEKISLLDQFLRLDTESQIDILEQMTLPAQKAFFAQFYQEQADVATKLVSTLIGSQESGISFFEVLPKSVLHDPDIMHAINQDIQWNKAHGFNKLTRALTLWPETAVHYFKPSIMHTLKFGNDNRSKLLSTLNSHFAVGGIPAWSHDLLETIRSELSVMVPFVRNQIANALPTNAREFMLTGAPEDVIADMVKSGQVRVSPKLVRSEDLQHTLVSHQAQMAVDMNHELKIIEQQTEVLLSGRETVNALMQNDQLSVSIKSAVLYRYVTQSDKSKNERFFIFKELLAQIDDCDDKYSVLAALMSNVRSGNDISWLQMKSVFKSKLMSPDIMMKLIPAIKKQDAAFLRSLLMVVGIEPITRALKPAGTDTEKVEAFFDVLQQDSDSPDADLQFPMNLGYRLRKRLLKASPDYLTAFKSSLLKEEGLSDANAKFLKFLSQYYLEKNRPGETDLRTKFVDKVLGISKIYNAASKGTVLSQVLKTMVQDKKKEGKLDELELFFKRVMDFDEQERRAKKEEGKETTPLAPQLLTILEYDHKSTAFAFADAMLKNAPDDQLFRWVSLFKPLIRKYKRENLDGLVRRLNLLAENVPGMVIDGVKDLQNKTIVPDTRRLSQLTGELKPETGDPNKALKALPRFNQMYSIMNYISVNAQKAVDEKWYGILSALQSWRKEIDEIKLDNNPVELRLLANRLSQDLGVDKEALFALIEPGITDSLIVSTLKEKLGSLNKSMDSIHQSKVEEYIVEVFKDEKSKYRLPLNTKVAILMSLFEANSPFKDADSRSKKAKDVILRLCEFEEIMKPELKELLVDRLEKFHRQSEEVKGLIGELKEKSAPTPITDDSPSLAGPDLEDDDSSDDSSDSMDDSEAPLLGRRYDGTT